MRPLSIEGLAGFWPRLRRERGLRVEQFIWLTDCRNVEKRFENIRPTCVTCMSADIRSVEESTVKMAR